MILFKVRIPNPFRAKTMYKLCYWVISFFHLSFHAISFAWDILRVCMPNRFVVGQFFVLPYLQIRYRVWNTVGHISNCCVKTETAIFIAMCTHHPHGIVNHSTKEKNGGYQVSFQALVTNEKYGSLVNLWLSIQSVMVGSSNTLIGYMHITGL